MSESICESTKESSQAITCSKLAVRMVRIAGCLVQLSQTPGIILKVLVILRIDSKNLSFCCTRSKQWTTEELSKPANTRIYVRSTDTLTYAVNLHTHNHTYINKYLHTYVGNTEILPLQAAKESVSFSLFKLHCLLANLRSSHLCWIRWRTLSTGNSIQDSPPEVVLVDWHYTDIC